MSTRQIDIVTDGLVFYIDAFNNLSYTSGDTTTNDLTQNKNGGTLTNGVGFDGKSFVFDGINDFINTNSIIPLVQNDTQGTISCWVKVNEVTSSDFVRPFLSAGNGVNPTYCTFGIRSNGTFGLGLVNNGKAWWSKATDNVVFEVGIWVNVSAVHNGSEATLYVNGVEVPQTYSTQTNKTYWFNFMSIDSITIGCQNYPISSLIRFVDGDISNVKYYNRALSQYEVLQNYNALKYRFD